MVACCGGFFCKEMKDRQMFDGTVNEKEWYLKQLIKQLLKGHVLLMDSLSLSSELYCR